MATRRSSGIRLARGGRNLLFGAVAKARVSTRVNGHRRCLAVMLAAVTVFASTSAAADGPASEDHAGASPRERVVAEVVPLVQRRLTLDRGRLGLDVNFTVADAGSQHGVGGSIAVGLARHLELRLAVDSGADTFVRLRDYRAFGVGLSGAEAGELSLTGQVLDARAVELAVELSPGILIDDFSEHGAHATFRAGIPLALHAGRFVRIDSGTFVKFVEGPESMHAVLVPLDVWIQPSDRFWFGPHTGFMARGASSIGGWPTSVQLGLGVGVRIDTSVAFKAAVQFPAIDHTTDYWGVSIGVELR